MNDAQKCNELRWDGSRRGFYEVYYLKFNDAHNRIAAWIRYTLTSPSAKGEKAVCELWGIFFDQNDPNRHFALKQSLPIENLSWKKQGFDLLIGQARLDHASATGEIINAQRGHQLHWDLEFDSRVPMLRHFPKRWMYTLPFPKTKVLSPHVHATFRGQIIANGRKIQLRQALGQQTHIWGTQHAKRWAWAHCNTFEQAPNVIFEGLDSQIALGPWTSPQLKLFFLYYDGAWHHFNHPAQWFQNQSDWKIGRWSFSATSQRLHIEGTATCRFEDMLAVTYHDPDGQRLWCNNSKLARLDLSLVDRKTNIKKNLSSPQGCALEFVDRRIYPQVPVWI